MQSKKIPILCAYSPDVIPQPKDWPAFCHTPGYWFLDPPKDWQPPKELVEFIESGPKPLSIGFGSMSEKNPEKTMRIIFETLETTKQRAVLISDWSGLEKSNIPDIIYPIDKVPHSWLFPKVSAVVHHGGAGTTGAGLRAGVPSILVPFGVDQPYWADIVVNLGVGPKAPPIKKLTAKKLAAAINQAISDKDMQAKAAALGAKIRVEDGISEAVKIIESLIK